MPALALEQVEAEICTLAARIAAGTCRYLELVAEFDRRDGWWRWPGVRSMADWLAWRCALTPRVAREHVRVARSLAELPQIHAEFKEGRLTYSKVRALTRIATRESEAELLELARHATAAQLERMIRAARRVSAQEAADSHERAHCFWDWEPDGSLRLNALLPAEEGAALVEALEAARSELARRRWEEAREGEEAAETAWRGSAEPGSDVIDGGSAGESDAPRTYRRPASHECLAHIAEQALARGPGRSSPADAYQVTVHVDAARLIEGDADDPPEGAAPEDDGACHLTDGPAISSASARRVACDAALVGVAHGPNGEPLSVGRRTRALSNLVLLCRRHHRLCHEGGYSITLDERGRPCFRPPGGRPIPVAPALGPASADLLGDSDPGAGAGAGEVLTGSGERMNLAYCVDAVLSAVGLRCRPG